MNLATARSTKRAREVGVRKTLGSNRSQLIQQFLTEAILLTFISFIIAVLLVKILLPLYNTIGGFYLELNLFSDPTILPALTLLMLVVQVD